MMDIEKNDIDIERLFQWGSRFPINDRFGNKKLDVYIRLIGDADINRSRVYALRNSHQLRMKLRDENSEERLAYIPNKSVASRNRILESLILFSTKDFTEDAIRAVNIKYPKEPKSTASLEEQEKYQKEVDTFIDRKRKAVEKEIEKKVQRKRKELEKLNDDDLYDEYVSYLIDQICESEMLEKYREMCVFFGTYKDSDYKERLFTDLEQLINLPKEIKDQLFNNYVALELGGEDLKKSLEAMP